jgi:hypothetical protein
MRRERETDAVAAKVAELLTADDREALGRWPSVYHGDC